MKQMQMFEPSYIELEIVTPVDEAVKFVSAKFDYAYTGAVKTTIPLPEIPKEYSVGVVVGPSGSGKTTILNTIRGEHKNHKWNNDAIISNFSSPEDGISRLGAAGLNSVPSWLKPYHVLSTGEKFRADIAMQIDSYAKIDEFTSVVNREVAMSCSVALSKYIKKYKLKNVTIATCHYDVLEYLETDWVYDLATTTFHTGRWLRQAPIELEVIPCSVKAWHMFKAHHYLTSEIHKSATCYLAAYNNTPVAFIALMHLTNRDVRTAWREHRVVVLPDYQGMGIGNKLSETLADGYKKVGKRYFSKTTNPRMGEHRNNSAVWRATANNMKNRPSYLKDGKVREQKGFGTRKEITMMHTNRTCYSHEYMGISMCAEIN